MKHAVTFVIAVVLGGAAQLASAEPSATPTATVTPAEPSDRPVSNRNFEGSNADRSGRTEAEMKAVNENAPHVLDPNGPATTQGKEGNPSSHPGANEKINKTSHPGSGQSTSHP